MYILPKPEQIMPWLSGSDSQILLLEDSWKLITFITPFERYILRWLPLGITSAPELFQRKMVETLQGLEETEEYVDDILVQVETENIHDRHLEQVLKGSRTQIIQGQVQVQVSID